MIDNYESVILENYVSKFDKYCYHWESLRFCKFTEKLLHNPLLIFKKKEIISL